MEIKNKLSTKTEPQSSYTPANQSVLSRSTETFRTINYLSSDESSVCTQSLHNSSKIMATSSESTFDSGYAKSINPCIGKNKYDHIKSKVKVYIEDIKHQENQRKQELQNNPKVELKSDIDQRESQYDDEVILAMDWYKSKYLDELVQNSNNQITIDDLKFQINQLKLKVNFLENKLNANSTYKTITPASIRSRTFNQTFFKTPIQNLSETLLSPFRSVSNITTDEGTNDGELVADLLLDHNGTSLKKSETTELVEAQKPSNMENQEISLTSAEPLIVKKRKSRFSVIKKVMHVWIPCRFNMDSNSECQVKQKKRARFNNKVYSEAGIITSDTNEVVYDSLVFVSPVLKKTQHLE